MDLNDFRIAVSGKLGLNNDLAFDQPLLDSWINQGVVDVIVRTHCKVSTATVTLTAGQYDYTLDAAIMAINETFVTDVTQSVMYRLTRVSAPEILSYRVGNQFVGAPPVRFYALDGSNLLMVYPTPAAADTITLYYVARPLTLILTTDTPSDIPAEWHKTVEYYALWQAGQYQNDAASQNGQVFLAMYEKELVKLRKAMQRMGGRRMSKAVVGNRLQRVIGRPDQIDV